MKISLYKVASDSLRRKTLDFIKTIEVDYIPDLYTHVYDAQSDTTYLVLGIYYFDKAISIRVSAISPWDMKTWYNSLDLILSASTKIGTKLSVKYHPDFYIRQLDSSGKSLE